MNQQENQRHYHSDYDEIDLRDIFKTLGKWKYKIIAITLACMLISGVASFFFMDPVYESKAVVATTSITPLTGPGNYSYIIKEDDFDRGSKVADNIDEMVRLAQVDSGKYQQLLISVPVLEETIKELGLKLKTSELKKMVKVESLKENNGVMEVKVETGDPEDAARIANSLVQQTIIYLGEINNRKIDTLKKTLESQLESAQLELEDSFGQLKEHQSRGIAGQSGDLRQNPEVDAEIEKRKLESKVKRSEELVNSLAAKLLQLEMFRSLNSAENQIIALSPAMAPEAPVKPNKSLNVAIAAVLGLMLSVFAAFLCEYLKNGKE